MKREGSMVSSTAEYSRMWPQTSHEATKYVPSRSTSSPVSTAQPRSSSLLRMNQGLWGCVAAVRTECD